MTQVIEYPLTPNIRAFNVLVDGHSAKVFVFRQPPVGTVCNQHRNVGAKCGHIDAVEAVLEQEQ